MRRRPAILLTLVAIAALVGVVPVLAAKSSTPAQAKDKPEKAPITLNGTIERSTDAGGKRTYTLADGGTTYTLEAGPRWFFGDAYPLEAYVRKTVKVEGEVAPGSTQVDVRSIDGVALRAEGKPPWAGGWKRVGSMHPGWSQEKADRMKAKFGDCFPPGQCKDKSAKPDNADESDEPDESEAP